MSIPKPEPFDAWCVFKPNGIPCLDLIYTSEYTARIELSRVTDLRMQSLQEQGYRCLPVTVTPKE